MNDLIKAQLFQLRKSRLPVVVFFVVLLLEVLLVFIQSVSSGTFSGSSFVAENGENIPAYALIFVIIFTGHICGVDFMDKTCNYELMSGHRRKDIYFSRAMVSILGSVLGAAFLLMAPVLIVNVIWGWGTDMDFSGVLLRYLLSLLPVFRMSCEFVFLTYIVKNAYVIMAGAYLVFVLYMSLPSIFPDAKSALLGITNYIHLYSFKAWQIYTVADLKQFNVYNSALFFDDVIATFIASIGFGMLFLMLGYLFFKKDDMN